MVHQNLKSMEILKVNFQTFMFFNENAVQRFGKAFFNILIQTICKRKQE
jgi:hypothetical protein